MHISKIGAFVQLIVEKTKTTRNRATRRGKTAAMVRVKQKIIWCWKTLILCTSKAIVFQLFSDGRHAIQSNMRREHRGEWHWWMTFSFLSFVEQTQLWTRLINSFHHLRTENKGVGESNQMQSKSTSQKCCCGASSSIAVCVMHSSNGIAGALLINFFLISCRWRCCPKNIVCHHFLPWWGPPRRLVFSAAAAVAAQVTIVVATS